MKFNGDITKTKCSRCGLKNEFKWPRPKNDEERLNSLEIIRPKNL
jgi:hypothetical protein